jgi:hypothetical protein
VEILGDLVPPVTTNAERLPEGLPLQRPERLFDPTRVKRQLPSNVPFSCNTLSQSAAALFRWTVRVVPCVAALRRLLALHGQSRLFFPSLSGLELLSEIRTSPVIC